MRRFLVSLLIFGGSVRANEGLPLEFKHVLETADKAVVYSLEPWGTRANDDRHFHVYEILGKTTLDAKDTRLATAEFERDAVPLGDAVAMCFDPRHALRIVLEGHTYDFLLCFRCVQLELDKDDKEIATIGASGSDKFLNAMLTRLHVPLSQTDTDEQMEARAKKDAALDAQWHAATPTWALPFYDKMRNDPTFNVAPLLAPLAGAYPNRQQRILALFQWYGSGEGSWTGYGVYEDVPERLLLYESTDDLIAAANLPSLTDAQIEGAARLFGGWDFDQKRPGDRAKLPTALKKMLLAHTLKSADKDKRECAKQAFR